MLPLLPLAIQPTRPSSLVQLADMGPRAVGKRHLSCHWMSLPQTPCQFLTGFSLIFPERLSLLVVPVVPVGACSRRPDGPAVFQVGPNAGKSP